MLKAKPWHAAGITAYLLNGSVPPTRDHLAHQMGLWLWDPECPLCPFRQSNLVSLPCLNWVSNPGPACLSKLPVLPVPTASTQPAPHVARPLGLVSLGHMSTWSTWWQLTSRSANKPAFLNKEWESRHTGPTAPSAHGGPSPQRIHARPSTSLDAVPQSVLGSALTDCCKGWISAHFHCHRSKTLTCCDEQLSFFWKKEEHLFTEII